MNMNLYGNRGMELETLVELANGRYRADGVAIVEKQHTHFTPIRNCKGKIISCKVHEKATVDFLGRYQYIPVAIEAKHTSTDRIRFDAVQDHQATFLDDFVGSSRNVFGAVLVSFKMERFFLVPWIFWRNGRILWKEKRGTSAEVLSFGMKWTTPGKASVSADELNPKWEVDMNGKYGLDYLSKIDTYIQVAGVIKDRKAI